MKAKKFFSLLFALALVIAMLSGCGGDSAETDTPDSQGSESAEGGLTEKMSFLSPTPSKEPPSPAWPCRPLPTRCWKIQTG